MPQREQKVKQGKHRRKKITQQQQEQFVKMLKRKQKKSKEWTCYTLHSKRRRRSHRVQQRPCQTRHERRPERGERRSARDTQRSRAQRARKQARAFWWGARSALGALGLVTVQPENPVTEYVAPAPSSSCAPPRDVTYAAFAALTDFLAPALVIEYVEPACAALCSCDFSEASTPVVVGSPLVYLTCPRRGTATPAPSAEARSRTTTLVCLTCSRGGTATPTPPAQVQSRSALLVCFTCPRGWHHQFKLFFGVVRSCVGSRTWTPRIGVPWTSAAMPADVFLVADILIAVVDREIEVSSAARKVVEVRDGCPSIVCSSCVSASYSHSMSC